MRIGVLTSSRADFGIYLPLLNLIKLDTFFKLEIIAFGTHLSQLHGYTVHEIEENGFDHIQKIPSLISNDSESSISSSYGLTVLKFADFWHNNKYDLVFCLGDRFEMSAAVQAGIPFGINYAHIHGGETTLGAIDNVYRHQISIASSFHFTAADAFSTKVKELAREGSEIHTVGALSLDGISDFKPLEKSIFYNKFSITQNDFALITFHPETLLPKLNKAHSHEMRLALEHLAKSLYLVISMPNADTMGSIFRNEIENLKRDLPYNVSCIENFGKENYFSAMHYSKFLIGNSSSGILEAASFGKYVVNVGKRQEGRLQNNNVINTSFQHQSIIDGTNHVLEKGEFLGVNQYHKEGAARKIIEILKTVYARL